MSENSEAGVERKTASALIYCDIQGFTRALDELDRQPEAEESLARFFSAWGRFRDLLIRPREISFKFNYYLANRIGDAFVIFSFVDRAESWFVFTTHYLKEIFEEFRAEVREFYPGFRTHLKSTIYTTESGKVPYFQTAPISQEIMGRATIARRDFISAGINICARIDALPEADRHIFLCNGPVYERLARAYADTPMATGFVEIGERRLRGVSNAQRIWGYGTGST